MASKKQWHPVFAELLRPLVESHFEVQINVPVGDVPRQADILLLRRTRAGPLPFTGLWRDLTTWNVLEFKGPTVSPRDEHLELLVALGLGIHRRLNEEQEKQRQPLLGPAEVSFWYLANRLGKRLLRGWQARQPGIEAHGPGIWRCVLLGRPLFLVSGVELRVEENSLPLHLIGKGSPETEQELARLVAGRPELWEWYSNWLLALHPAAYGEVKDMAKRTKEKFEPSLEPFIDLMGLKWVIDKVGLERVIREAGLERVIREVGLKRVLDVVTVEDLLEHLPPDKRRELKRRLEE